MTIVETTSPRSSGDGFERLLQRLGPRSAGMLRRYRIPEEDAEDILQEVFLIFFLKRPEVLEPEKWLLGTLRNRCLMYWRERRRSRFLTINSVLLDATADPRLSRQSRRAVIRDLRRLMRRLPPRFREILETRFFEGLSPAETARRLGYRESAIYKMIDRSKAALVREMATESLAEGIAWSQD